MGYTVSTLIESSSGRYKNFESKLQHLFIQARRDPVWFAINHTESRMAGVFKLSDSAGHINNCNDARGPQTYDVHVHIIGKSGRSVNLPQTVI
jgi:diadenosine tetraphosphate (Ap4A) HIT family hydrolase